MRIQQPTYGHHSPQPAGEAAARAGIGHIHEHGSREEVRYPRQSELALGALPGAVPCARLHVTAVLHEWGLGHLVEPVQLVVSEIVTNAIQASAGLLELGFKTPFIHLWLSADQGRVVVRVWDASNDLPEQQQPGPEAEHGRGLMLVQAMAEDYGTYRLEGGNGKIVWARLTSDTPHTTPG
jgi:anti-sigma regulatory factor (Ser/Thr protein kinase)